MTEKELFKKTIDKNITNKNNIFKKINIESVEESNMKLNYKKIIKGVACVATLTLIISAVSGIAFNKNSSNESSWFTIKAAASTNISDNGINLKSISDSQNSPIVTVGKIEGASNTWHSITSSPIFTIEGENIDEIEYSCNNGSFNLPYHVPSENFTKGQSEHSSLCNESIALNKYKVINENSPKAVNQLENPNIIKVKHKDDMVYYIPLSLINPSDNTVKTGIIDTVTVKVKFKDGHTSSKTVQLSVNKSDEKPNSLEGVEFIYKIEATIQN
ncbi:MAG: hypothetical protein ACRC7N_13425 [Clostridium sp.]